MSDLPSIYFAFYLQRLLRGGMSPAAKLEMLQEAFNRNEINRGEFRRLIGIPLPDPPVNAPGGDA